MKALLINTVCYGSTGRLCESLASVLTAAGHDVRLAYGRGEPTEAIRPYATRIGTDADVYRHALRARLTDGAGLGSRRATERFLAWARSYDPDVIHLHNLHGYYLHTGLLFDWLRSCGRPILWTMHDAWAFTGHSPLCAAAGCERWERGCHACPLRREYPRSLPDRSAANWQRKRACFSGVPGLRLVTPSLWLAEQARRSFLGGYPVTVIPNGVDTARFCLSESPLRRERGWERRWLVLAAASVWNDMKGWPELIALARQLGEDYAVAALGRPPRRLGSLPSNLSVIGSVQGSEELARYYSAADVFVHLSRCDTYPAVLLEAAACGTPVLTFDSGGCAEAAASVGGTVIPVGDIDAAAQTIRAFRANGAPPVIPPADESETARAYLTQYLGKGASL